MIGDGMRRRLTGLGVGAVLLSFSVAPAAVAQVEPCYPVPVEGCPTDDGGLETPPEVDDEVLDAPPLEGSSPDGPEGIGDGGVPVAVGDGELSRTGGDAGTLTAVAFLLLAAGGVLLRRLTPSRVRGS
ncbi:hypothetical protein [Egicoccus halophilus]|uniref:LPXTG-motif cell wall anchor domain-containing protein n=1 Tax=Egicoccus halophilus TaxID=1670830 RepID=A0A8J3ESW9_9ACTN|nr:hypothetical protein [Egicoccus halophilus]GGI03978.1 hypothetical protein GCM10011354_06750 [Egicoccus halophilus]